MWSVLCSVLSRYKSCVAYSLGMGVVLEGLVGACGLHRIVYWESRVAEQVRAMNGGWVLGLIGRVQEVDGEHQC